MEFRPTKSGLNLINKFTQEKESSESRIFLKGGIKSLYKFMFELINE